MDGPVDRLHTVVYTALSYGLSLPKGDDCGHSQNSACRSMTSPCQNRGQQKVNGRLFGYTCVSVSSVAGANNLENQCQVLADSEQVFEDVGRGTS